MRINKISQTIACLLLVYYFGSACTYRGETDTPIPTIVTAIVPTTSTRTTANIATVPTITVTPTATSQKALPLLSLLKPIYVGSKFPVGSYRLIWWSSDSQTIFYRIVQDVWQYSITTGIAVLAEGELYLTPTPSSELQVHMPPDMVGWSISPSGKLALYLRPVWLTTPTLQPIATNEPVDGEDWKAKGNVELWAVLSNGSSVKIGEIEWCVQDYIWSDDEMRVVIDDIPPPALCMQSDAWLVDFDTMRVQALFPKEIHQYEVSVGNLSPNGEWLLYFEEGNWYVLDLGTFDSQKLQVPSVSYVQWIDSHNLFVEYWKEDRNSWTFGIYRIEKSNLEELLIFAETPSLRGSRPITPVISPDQQWVAFAVGKNRYYADSIWSMKLPDSR